MSAQNLSFPPQNRLKKPSEYRQVFENPVKSSDKYFTLLAIKNDLPFPRLGLAIAKKSVKRAVARNRIKRVARESFRFQHQRLANIDIVVLARGDAANVPLAILRTSLERHWRKLVERCDSCS